MLRIVAALAALWLAVCVLLALPPATPAIQFSLARIPFTLENDETVSRHAPATMAGGVAVFDYNHDGRPDIFFTNGANLQTLVKDDPKYRNRLFRNDGNGVFTDVTDQAGLAGIGYATGAAAGDYDNDGYPDLFVAGVHRVTLYHNNGNGTFTDVTAQAGLGKPDPQYGPLWSVAAAWLDANNDGLLDLFVVNYVQWDYATEHRCFHDGVSEYCSPTFFQGLPDQLFLNKGNGKFQDVSAAWGLRDHIGKGMGAAVADYDLDGKPDIFVTNDTYYNFLFHNTGSKFEDKAFETNTALVEDGNFISGMGVDFQDVDNDGYPDIFYAALAKQTFPFLKNISGKEFHDIGVASGMRALTMPMAGFGAAIADFDNDGWKDLFVTRGDVLSLNLPGVTVDQPNTVFHNPGPNGNWKALTEEAGFTAATAARHRGCAIADFDGDGRLDIVATALGKPAEIWLNRTKKTGNWLEIQLHGTRSAADAFGAVVSVTDNVNSQRIAHSNSTCYASSADLPVHIGLGEAAVANDVEIRWPSGLVQHLGPIKANQRLNVTEPAR
jgi:hypothetical protein